MSDCESGKFRYYKESNLFHGSLMNIMGTRFDILVIGKQRQESEAIWYSVDMELKRLNNMLSRFNELSEISRINDNATKKPVTVTSEMWNILNDCRRYNQKTLGLFDVTLKDFTKVVLNEHKKSVVFSDKDIKIDFGGYGKGYALKKIKDILIKNKVQNSFVDFGNSSILGIGHHPHGDAWKVTINNPYKNGETVDELSLKDSALSISGNTPTYNNHIINPVLGKLNGDQKTVAIITDDPLEAEVLSTAFMIADETEKKEIKNSFNILFAKEYILQ